jgi:dTDP-4-dehydrorhamnose reductase
MILICGASGLVGRELCKYLQVRNVPFIGTYNRNKIDGDNMYQIDFKNPAEIKAFLISHQITVCVFSIVERLTDKCENSWNEIKITNVDLVHNTSYICNELHIRFIHISTDYVFDGSNQPNYPDSPKNPLQNYGISKLISEYRVMKNCTDHCIIRTPVLYSSLSKVHDNAVCLIGKNIMDLRRNKTFKEDNYSIRRPLYIQDLCAFIYDTIQNENGEKNGIYHFYNPFNKFTKFEISEIIANYLEMDASRILPNNSVCDSIAPRPYDTQLIDTKFNIYDYKFTDFDETIHECFHKFKHPKINLENKDDYFIMIDLDGTLIDSSRAHYNAYKKTMDMYNISFLTFDEWNDTILNDHIDNYFAQHFTDILIKEIKENKASILNEEEIRFTKNSEQFLEYLIENDFRFCIVTNTSKNAVDIFKQKLQILSRIKNWIYRDDCNKPKPSPECWELAKSKYYNNEKYIIAIEDSYTGYKSIKDITDLVYIFNNEQVFKHNDCFLFVDFDEIY